MVKPRDCRAVWMDWPPSTDDLAIFGVMKMKHSPGPYGITKHATHSAQFGIYSESNDSGGDLAIICTTGNDDETAANAALFAAAPELLEVVDRFNRACKAYLTPHLEQAFCGIFAAANEAIAKAVQS